MGRASDIFEWIKRSPTKLDPAFFIPPERIIGRKPKIAFKAKETYFEFRIAEQFLRDRREYWKEYNPITIVLGQFIYDGKRRSFPFIVGPNLLHELEKPPDKQRVRYKNTRVVGPTPYLGGDVTFFVGLYRVQIRDWAQEYLSLLETMAGAFDTTRLTSYLNYTTVVFKGIEKFLGMDKQCQDRITRYETFTDPSDNDSNPFLPGFYAIIKENNGTIEEDKLWVKHDQLYIGDNKSKIKPYLKNDYILYKINPIDKRKNPDTFDFHRIWKKIQKHIWADNEKMAEREFTNLMEQIFCCPDLIKSTKNQFQFMYKKYYIEELAAFKNSINPKISIKEYGQNEYNEFIDTITNQEVENEIVDALSESQKLLFKGAKIKRKTDKRKIPMKVGRKEMNKILSSKILNKEAIKRINSKKLTSALSIGMSRY